MYISRIQYVLHTGTSISFISSFIFSCVVVVFSMRTSCRTRHTCTHTHTGGMHLRIYSCVTYEIEGERERELNSRDNEEKTNLSIFSSSLQYYVYSLLFVCYGHIWNEIQSWCDVFMHSGDGTGYRSLFASVYWCSNKIWNRKKKRFR